VANTDRKVEEHILKDIPNKDPVLLDAIHGLIQSLEKIEESQPGGNVLEASEIDLKSNIQDILLALEQSQHSLQESEARYRAIVESQTEVICRINPEGTITFLNDAFRRYFAAFGEITPGQNIFELLPENQRKLIHDQIDQLSPSHPETQIEFALAFPNRETRWQQWNGMGNYSQQGILTEIQIVGHDITDRKLAELAARQHNRELSALHAATAALLTTLDPEALLSRILDAAISSIPAAKKGMIHLIAQDTGQLEMRASVGYTDPRIKRVRIPATVGYVARAVREHTPLLIRDLHADPANLTGISPEGQDIQSAIVAPLVIKGVVLGAVSLESTKIAAFNESDLRLLVSFAATATAAIQNARLHSEVQKLAITDALTGLYNRRGLFELGQREVERSRRYKRPLVAIMMDIDHFKFINDYYGHTVGDQVLQAVAKRCSDNLRRIDILGRLGGDEFTFLLPETDMFTASHVAERVRLTVAERPVVTEETPISISVSLGVARATSATPDLEVLISRADAAMYVAKREGRNRVEYG
jgi:diguanylate cyclase (GGDEF)-like protein/PAS domain S-box-containing protein